MAEVKEDVVTEATGAVQGLMVDKEEVQLVLKLRRQNKGIEVTRPVPDPLAEIEAEVEGF